MDPRLSFILASLVEAFALHRVVFVDATLRTVALAVFGVNLGLLAVWNVAIYPFFVTPLRHLPTAPVFPFYFKKKYIYIYIYITMY